MPLTSTHWGTYYTEVRGGKLVGMHPFGQDADPSDIGKGLVGTLDAPTRIICLLYTSPSPRDDR